MLPDTDANGLADARDLRSFEVPNSSPISTHDPQLAAGARSGRRWVSDYAEFQYGTGRANTHGTNPADSLDPRVPRELCPWRRQSYMEMPLTLDYSLTTFTFEAWIKPAATAATVHPGTPGRNRVYTTN
jgi:hypothetical protein